MAADTINAPLRREQKSFAQRIRGLWRRIEPGFDITDSFVERYDGVGEGPAKCLSFEGFGLSFLFFIGRTPRFQPDGGNDREAGLSRFYNGEGR